VSRPSTANSPALEVRAKLFRGLADAARLGILLRLAERSHSAGELASACELSPSNASNHLRCLLECGLVQIEARGRQNLYRLVDPRVTRLLAASDALLSSPAGKLITECCNYERVSRRALRSASPGMTRSFTNRGESRPSGGPKMSTQRAEGRRPPAR
jgi:ArsR family transcriptional regulator, cadmium/lead-responsive transcriptional repressor